MVWKRILGYIWGFVNEELRSCIEFLVSENRILRGRIKERILFSEAERKTLAEIGERLGKRFWERSPVGVRSASMWNIATGSETVRAVFSLD